MSTACLEFGTPVTGGNVSFYNQTMIGGKTEPVLPTPTIGMLGVIDDKKHQTGLSFRNKGHVIFMIGESKNDISSSEYLVSYHGVKESPVPFFDIKAEHKVQDVVSELIKEGLINSAHDVSDGGLMINLLESSMLNNLGFDITADAEVRTDAFLFGEAQSRIVVTVSLSQEDKFIDFLIKSKVPFSTLGHVTKGDIRIDDKFYGNITDLKEQFNTALEDKINK